MQQETHFPGFAFAFKIDARGDATPLPPGMADGDKDY